MAKPRADTNLAITSVSVGATEITVTGNGAEPFDVLNFEASYTPDDGTTGRLWQESGWRADEHGNFSFQLNRTGISVPGIFDVDVYLDKTSSSTRVAS